jgi:hypothetical protein
MCVNADFFGVQSAHYISKNECSASPGHTWMAQRPKAFLCCRFPFIVQETVTCCFCRFTIYGVPSFGKTKPAQPERSSPCSMLVLTCSVQFCFYFICVQFIIHMPNSDIFHRIYSSWCFKTDLAEYAIECAKKSSEITATRAAELVKALVI